MKYFLIGSLCFIAGFLAVFLHISDNVMAAIIAGFVALGVGLLNVNNQRKLSERASKNAQKAEMYREFIDLVYYRTLHSERLPEDERLTNEELEHEFVRFKVQVITWASAEVIRAFLDYLRIATGIDETESSDELQSLRMFRPMEKLLTAIRKDLGHDDSELEEFDYISVFVNPNEIDNLRSML